MARPSLYPEEVRFTDIEHPGFDLSICQLQGPNRSC